jgi:hypothetical protein
MKFLDMLRNCYDSNGGLRFMELVQYHVQNPSELI